MSIQARPSIELLQLGFPLESPAVMLEWGTPVEVLRRRYPGVFADIGGPRLSREVRYLGGLWYELRVTGATGLRSVAAELPLADDGTHFGVVDERLNALLGPATNVYPPAPRSVDRVSVWQTGRVRITLEACEFKYVHTFLEIDANLEEP